MEPVRHRNPIRYSLQLFASCILAIGLASCGPKDTSSKDNDEDSGLRKKPIDESKWSTEEVADGGVGLFTKLALAKDGPVVAYYADKSRTGDPCTAIAKINDKETPRNGQLWDLFFSHKVDGIWQKERVSPVLWLDAAIGLDLKISPTGTPTIVTLTGESIVSDTLQYCGANDLGYFLRKGEGTWDLRTVVRNSGEAAVSGDTAISSNFGQVVGFWPALAYDSKGNAAVAYRDVHEGGLQSDDFRRADLEIALQTGYSWHAVAVDWGRSAGEYNRLVFDKKNRPVVLYHLPGDSNDFSQQGLWVARSADNGATWQKVRLFPKPVPLQPDIAVDPNDGSLYVVYYNKDSRIIYLATLVDDNAFESSDKGWTFKLFGDPLYDEGRYSSIAIDPDGRIGVAYFRCSKANETSDVRECAVSESNALVFAWREIGRDGAWTIETIEKGESSVACGQHTSLAFDGEGAAYIAYMCQYAVTKDLVEDRVRLATRKPL